jgi:hypothetical protein
MLDCDKTWTALEMVVGNQRVHAGTWHTFLVSATWQGRATDVSKRIRVFWQPH